MRGLGDVAVPSGPRLSRPAAKAATVLGYLALLAGSTLASSAITRAQVNPLLIESVESPYNSIYIVRQGSLLAMRFGAKRKLFTESLYNPRDPEQLPSTYSRFMTLGMAYTRTLDSVVELGVGGGRTIWYLHKTLPNARITSVEIDPEVLRLAHKHFGLREEPGLRLVNSDGRLFLAQHPERHDLILIDAYRGAFVPFHLLTREFYQLAASRLKPGGAIVQNVEPSTMVLDSAVRTLASVLPNVDLYRANNNIVMIAYAGPRLSDAALRAAAMARQATVRPRYDLRDMVAERHTLGVDGVSVDASVPVLTDDFAPVEILKATERHNQPWQNRPRRAYN